MMDREGIVDGLTTPLHMYVVLSSTHRDTPTSVGQAGKDPTKNKRTVTIVSHSVRRLTHALLRTLYQTAALFLLLLISPHMLHALFMYYFYTMNGFCNSRSAYEGFCHCRLICLRKLVVMQLVGRGAAFLRNGYDVGFIRIFSGQTRRRLWVCFPCVLISQTSNPSQLLVT